MSFGEVARPIPRNAGIGAYLGKAGMTNYQNVKLSHLRSFRNVAL